jgi:hypothetical protein
MAKQLSSITLAAMPLLLIAILPDALAHKPLDSSNNNSLEAPTVIPDIQFLGPFTKNYGVRILISTGLRADRVSAFTCK